MYDSHIIDNIYAKMNEMFHESKNCSKYSKSGNLKTKTSILASDPLAKNVKGEVMLNCKSHDGHTCYLRNDGWYLPGGNFYWSQGPSKGQGGGCNLLCKSVGLTL